MKKFAVNSSSREAQKRYLTFEAAEHTKAKRLELGEYNTFHYMSDPKRLTFLFARYKFVSKMLEGLGSALEIGCQEGLGTGVVARSVRKLVATDFFVEHIESCKKRLSGFMDNVEFRPHDITGGPVKIRGGFDAAYCLDVFEHIDPSLEREFFKNVTASLKKTGVLIIGIPSLESQVYASEASRAQHVNCKSGKDLKALCLEHFDNVFMFGMNDETLHTGFLPMSHYLIALCAGVKK